MTIATKLLPMLAKPLPAGFKPQAGMFFAEEKFDGHRMVVEVLSDRSVKAWSRTGKDCVAKISTKMYLELASLVPGIYDGELLLEGGGHSYDVTRLENHNTLTYIMFDVLQYSGVPMCEKPYENRRACLEGMFKTLTLDKVKLAPSWKIDSKEHMDEIAGKVWSQAGEGLIIKRRDGVYRPGKRTDSFLKIKECYSDVLTVIGFVPSAGEIMNRGPYATVVLRDSAGTHVVVKTIDDAMCRRLEQVAGPGCVDVLDDVRLPGGTKITMNINHPYVGKSLRIEYHQKTPDGSYRHPRWDRFEDE